MADLANISLTGRMGADAQVTETTNSSVAKFSLAVNGFKKDELSWFNCEAWGKVGPWSFKELLLFRERCKRDNRDYGDRLDVIERLVRWDALWSCRRDAGIFGWRGPVGSPRPRRLVRRRPGKRGKVQ